MRVEHFKGRDVSAVTTFAAEDHDMMTRFEVVRSTASSLSRSGRL
jgi:hypothetical protein